MTAALVAALLATTGALLLRSALSPVRPPLALELARLLDPAPAETLCESRDRAIVARLIDASERAGPRWERIRSHLAVTDGELPQHVVQCVGAGLALGTIAGLLALLLAIGGAAVPGAVVALAVIAATLGGFAMPTALARQAADERRAQMRAALPGYLDLVGVMLAAGESLESALRHAAALADSWPYLRLREALDRAAVTRHRASDEFAALGQRLSVMELVEVSDGLAVASTEGTAVRTSLAARTRGLRERQLAAAETAAGRATEGMSFPLVALVVGFILLIGYPAMVGLSSGLGAG